MSLWTFVSNALANREARRRRRRRAVTLYELCVGLEWWLLLQSAWHFRQTATRTSKRWLRGLSWIQLEHVSILYFCLRVVAMMQCGPATPLTWSMPMSHDIMMLPLETMWTTYHFCLHGRYNSIRDNAVYMKDDKGILGYVQCGILGDVGFHSRSTNS